MSSGHKADSVVRTLIGRFSMLSQTANRLGTLVCKPIAGVPNQI